MSANSSKLKLIIDTDPGVDDCHAIMMALSSKNIELIGLSCVSGNTSLENGLKNLHFLLQTFERREIPIFRGAERALDGRQKYAPHIHGENGFGGAMSAKQMQLDLIQEEPASVALVRLAKEYRGELIIAAIGPLTNLAIAQRLDPNFSRNLKQLHIMGGNCTIPRFQTLSMGIEFNFACDPIAAAVVLEEFQCPMRIVTFEATCMATLPFAMIENELFALKDQSEKARFFHDVTKFLYDFTVTHENNPDLYTGLNSCDSVCLATVIDPSIVKETKPVYACVEPSGHYHGGIMICDWYQHFKRAPNVEIVSNIDKEKFQQLFRDSIKNLFF